MRDVLVVLSGGLDSSTALAQAVEEYGAERVRGIGFDYGQRHSRELRAAVEVSAHFGTPYEVRNISGTLTGSALIDPEVPVPDGHYAEESMQSTVVHGRNLLFASLSVAALGVPGRVVLGVHAGDHHIYPDCRPEFWGALSELSSRAYGVDLVTPFLTLSKSGIVKVAEMLGAPSHLTWSCYKGGDAHCGTCGTCVERREAFDLAEVPDPTVYL